MTIVATTETRNSKWANDPNAFGRKMLSKMGWKGEGLGKNQQGTSTHLRAVKRAESLGIGADTDAFGEKGWNDTNAGFHGVLAKLKREHSSIGGSDDDNGQEVDEATKKKRRKEEKKRKKKEEKRRAKKLRKSSESGNSSSGSDTGHNNTSGGNVRLPQNKVQAGHARKMREAKDIRNKSAADMAAIFGVKADLYKQPKQWVDDNNGGNNDDTTKRSSGIDNDASIVVEKKKKKSKKKKSKDVKEGSDGIDKPKKDKKKRKRSNDGDASSSTHSDDASQKKKRKKDKAKK